MRLDGPFLDESKSEIRLGLQTLNLGSRRLVARNSHRNTVNAFTGAFWEWRAKEGPTIQGFYFLPQDRLPSDAASLLGNRIHHDEERFDLQFWGLHSQWGGLPLGGEAYYYGLNEGDAVGFATRDRNLHTFGLRFFRPRAKGPWDWDFESAAQFGSARGSAAAADTDDLDHLAISTTRSWGGLSRPHGLRAWRHSSTTPAAMRAAPTAGAAGLTHCSAPAALTMGQRAFTARLRGPTSNRGASAWV